MMVKASLVPFLAAAVASVNAQSPYTATNPLGQGLTITEPSSDIWWVKGSANTVAWTCHSTTLTNFTLVALNPNTQLLSGPDALIAQLNNFDCSETITPTFDVGTGYQLALGNPFNETDFYAVSEPFEIRAAGSTYPTVTTTDLGGSSTSSSGSATSTGSTSAPSPTTSKSAAVKVVGSSGLLGLVSIAIAFLA
ncbi:hypothetical protein SISNIDRAFT_493303 [Sistotremastrum niveocremeum HHB9708]|uniref:Yeast cell wall synthesis Kre9/Knh1-like N-terminal domain-containing protein n=1 Tax=Sistotremastrum niveocremeum HHB9708 TaxID=1314777 RepID=A0A164YMH5_9AGAM|nr:hypothetical protein SISNIDRAFT_493303 [Sistotremastrum niveocremeum HHB9708]